jgi:hypothetical protein
MQLDKSAVPKHRFIKSNSPPVRAPNPRKRPGKRPGKRKFIMSNEKKYKKIVLSNGETIEIENVMATQATKSLLQKDNTKVCMS